MVLFSAPDLNARPDLRALLLPAVHYLTTGTTLFGHNAMIKVDSILYVRKRPKLA